MGEPDFHQTRMGQRFYEHTMPELVRQIERLVEKLPVPELSFNRESLLARATRYEEEAARLRRMADEVSR
jgi:hypothetical protein